MAEVWSYGLDGIPALPSSTWLGGKSKLPRVQFPHLQGDISPYKICREPAGYMGCDNHVRFLLRTHYVPGTVRSALQKSSGFISAAMAWGIWLLSAISSSLERRAGFHRDHGICLRSHPGSGRSGMWSGFRMAPSLRMPVFSKHAAIMRNHR